MLFDDSTTTANVILRYEMARSLAGPYKNTVALQDLFTEIKSRAERGDKVAAEYLRDRCL